MRLKKKNLKSNKFVHFTAGLLRNFYSYSQYFDKEFTYDEFEKDFLKYCKYMNSCAFENFTFDEYRKEN